MGTSKTGTEPSDRFAPLPVVRNAAGEVRRTGVEVEFSGLSEEDVAEVITQRLGGRTRREDAHHLTVEGSELGGIGVELDTALAKKEAGALGTRAAELLRGLVPVELISEPLTPPQIAVLDGVIADLREAGAIGSRDGVLLGFGVHLNIEVVAVEDRHTFRTVRAFALLDPVLRAQDQIDVTRRILPFVNPWPRPFVTLLVRERPDSMADLIDLSDPYIRNRNHALDLLPLFKCAQPALFEASFPEDSSTSARPAFHFRLPDSRINEGGWSLREAWDMWGKVEDVAASDRLEALEAAWLEHAARAVRTEASWIREAREILGDAG